MLQYASVEDAYMQPAISEPREHRRKGRRKDEPAHDPPQSELLIKPSEPVTTQPIQRYSHSIASLQSEMLRMLPYGAVLFCVAVISLLFDIRNTLHRINANLPAALGRYPRY